MKTATGSHIHPETGYGIARFIAPNETASGIIVPGDAAADPRGKLVMVETSGAYIVDGCRQECGASAGDILYLQPQRMQKRDPRGKVVDGMGIRTAPINGLPDHYIIMLVDVTHFERPAGSEH